MFKATPALQGTLRRLPLSVKQAGKEYYKGNRVGSMGTITRYGNFVPDWDKIRTYVFPVLGTKNAEVCQFLYHITASECSQQGMEQYVLKIMS